MDDPSSYVYDDFAASSSTSPYPDPFGQGTGMVWPYGAENWCNLEGSYLHFVADLS